LNLPSEAGKLGFRSMTAWIKSKVHGRLLPRALWTGATLTKHDTGTASNNPYIEARSEQSKLAMLDAVVLVQQCILPKRPI
jgi:hypothetical protein